MSTTRTKATFVARCPFSGQTFQRISDLPYTHALSVRLTRIANVSAAGAIPIPVDQQRPENIGGIISFHESLAAACRAAKALESRGQYRVEYHAVQVMPQAETGGVQ